MAYNIRVNKLLKGLNVSLEDFKFYMSNDDITTSSKINVITNGDIVYNPKLMTTIELVEMRESLLKDIESKEICRLYKLLDEAKGEVRRIDEAILEIELRHFEDESDFEASEDWEQMTYDEKGPWSPNWFKEERTASEALEDLKRKMEKEKDDDQDLSGTFPLTRL
jgi:hypothetical protein|tara:strand:- start:2208 stop:2705 length:498 start_codon:yes stop_codon:yes gene_type:complete